MGRVARPQRLEADLAGLVLEHPLPCEGAALGVPVALPQSVAVFTGQASKTAGVVGSPVIFAGGKRQ